MEKCHKVNVKTQKSFKTRNKLIFQIFSLLDEMQSITCYNRNDSLKIESFFLENAFITAVCYEHTD